MKVWNHPDLRGGKATRAAGFFRVYLMSLKAVGAKPFDVAEPDIFSAALRTAFAEFKLDPVDPFSWRILLAFFAYIEFGKRLRRAGAPKKWDAERLAELRAELEQVQADNAGISDKEIARRLAPDPRFGTKGSDAAAGREGLRKAIRKARRDFP